MQGWEVSLYSIWFTQILSLMSFGMGMPFLPYYIQQLGVTDPESIKWLSSFVSAAPAVMMAIMAPIWGKMSDTYGKKLMVMRAMIAGVVIMFGLGMAQHVWQVVVLRVFQGMFTGTITAAMALVASTVPEKRMGFALGLMASSTAIGNSLGPAVGGFLAEWLGYRYSFFCGSLLMCVGLVILIFMVQEPPNPIKKNLRDQLTRRANNAERKPFIEVLKTSFVFKPWFVSAMILLLLLRFINTIFGPFLPLMVQEKLGGLQGASATTGLFNAFSGAMIAISGLTLGKLSDKFNRVKLLAIYSLIGFALAIPLSLHGSIWALMVNYGCMMFFVGGIEPVISAITTSHTERTHRGTMIGVQAFVGSMGWGLAPILGGFIATSFSVAAVLVAIPVMLVLEFCLVRFLAPHLNA